MSYGGCRIMKRLKIIHLAGSISPYYSFGLGAVAVNLAKYQRELGHDAEVWCVDSDVGIDDACSEYKFSAKHVKSFQCLGSRYFAYSPAMEAYMKKGGAKSFDVLHQHGIWTLLSRVSNIWSGQYNKLKLIAPHGSLHSVALKKSPFKKRLACFFYEHKNLSSASCLQATSLAEIDDFRNFGLINKVELVPNGVSLQEEDPSLKLNNFREKFSIDKEKRLILYLSRITPKKGIPMFLHSLAALADKIGDWHIIIAGTEEENHKKEVKSLISELDLGRYITLLGPLYAQDKRNAFKECDLFILPSYSEGSPIVILEALASGLPVITTKASPWEDLVTHMCGWWCDISTDSITNALKEATSLSKNELVNLGVNGKNLVEAKYSWHSAANKTIDLYTQLIEDSSVRG